MIILTTILFILALFPLFLSAKLKTASAKKRAIIINIASVCFVVVLTFSLALSASASEADATEAVIVGSSISTGSGLGYIAAALAVGLSCLGTGIAVASSASAAIGAISENSSMFVQALIFVALAEGIALYGLLIAFQILAKL